MDNLKAFQMGMNDERPPDFEDASLFADEAEASSAKDAYLRGVKTRHAADPEVVPSNSDGVAIRTVRVKVGREGRHVCAVMVDVGLASSLGEAAQKVRELKVSVGTSHLTRPEFIVSQSSLPCVLKVGEDEVLLEEEKGKQYMCSAVFDGKCPPGHAVDVDRLEFVPAVPVTKHEELAFQFAALRKALLRRGLVTEHELDALRDIIRVNTGRADEKELGVIAEKAFASSPAERAD